jgi:hypothetical protein
MPDGHKIPRANGHKIYLPSQHPPKFTQIGIFWFENEQSGNPVLNRFIIKARKLGEKTIEIYIL